MLSSGHVIDACMHIWRLVTIKQQPPPPWPPQWPAKPLPCVQYAPSVRADRARDGRHGQLAFLLCRACAGAPLKRHGLVLVPFLICCPFVCVRLKQCRVYPVYLLSLHLVLALAIPPFFYLEFPSQTQHSSSWHNSFFIVLSLPAKLYKVLCRTCM